MRPTWAGDNAAQATTLNVDLSGLPIGPVQLLSGFTTAIDNGQLTIAVSFVAPSDTSSIGSYYLWSAQSSDGLAAIRYDSASGHYIFTVRGADVLSITKTIEPVNIWTPNNQSFRTGDHVTLRSSYHPASGVANMQLFVNGCAGEVMSGVATGSPLSSLTSLYVGSNLGASPLAAQLLRITASLYCAGYDNGCNSEFVVIGDSTSASLSPTPGVSGGIANGNAIYTPSEAAVRLGITSIAFPGATSPTQQAQWSASRFTGDGRVIAPIEMTGLNDLVQDGQTAAQTITRIQSLVNTILASNPLARIVLLTMTPTAFYLGPKYPVAWNTVNTAIMGGGGTPITGVAARVNAHTIALDDGSGNLKVIYDSGDHIHPNDLGRATVIAPAIRAALVSLGLL